MTHKIEKTPLLVVVGPTASGKTALAVELALLLNGEIISADSMQVYKRMDIATAKPSAEERKGTIHHLIDFIEPDDAAFSVADYARLAHRTIAEITARGKLPILAGGTGMYLDAILNNIDFDRVQGDASVRAELSAMAEEKGREYLLDLLREVDPALAQTLHPNNIGRILRGLEVWRVTGITMSEQQRRSRMMPERYDSCVLGIRFSDRAVLYERVNQRVDEMMARGLLDETREILRLYGGTARQAIGYKELRPFLDGESSLETCVDKLKQATRNYAKRQLTWFRRDPRIHWLDAQGIKIEELVQMAMETVHKSGIM